MYFFGHDLYLAMVFTVLTQPLYGNGIHDTEVATFQQCHMQLLFSYYLAMADLALTMKLCSQFWHWHVMALAHRTGYLVNHV